MGAVRPGSGTPSWRWHTPSICAHLGATCLNPKVTINVLAAMSYWITNINMSTDAPTRDEPHSVGDLTWMLTPPPLFCRSIANWLRRA